jgi:tetratricopeptide (TPR) repeat protein
VPSDRWLDVVGQAVDADEDAEHARTLWEEAVRLASGPYRRSFSLTRLAGLDVQEGQLEQGLRRYREAAASARAPFVYHGAGEELLAAGVFDAAEEWLRQGAELLIEDDPDHQLSDLLELWDQALEATGRDGGQLREQAGAIADDEWFEDVRDTGAPITLPWHPGDLWDEVVAAGELPESLRAPTHREYSRRVEASASGLRSEGVRVVAVRPVGVHGETVGEPIHWPPGRNEPCWCGSGDKYKRCCGRR